MLGSANPFPLIQIPNFSRTHQRIPHKFFPKATNLTEIQQISTEIHPNSTEISAILTEIGMKSVQSKIKLNVGGKCFVTSSTTLANAGRDSMLAAMIDEDWQIKPNMDEFFIDRNPSYFSVLLDLLRTGELHIPRGMSEKALYREALYYGILDRVRAAKWGHMDGNRMEHVASISGRAIGDATAIRAAPDGGCCVAHGSMVHVYDWTMEEQAPLTLDYQVVNDVGFLNSQRVAICSCERVDKGGGGMAVFNTRTGKVEYKFQVCHDGQPKNFTAGALTSSLDHHVYASCRGRSNEYGVGSWDQTTGQQVDFFYEVRGWPLGEAGKLQWLPENRLLLVATLYPLYEDSYISLLDFRAKKLVWSWTDSEISRIVDDKVVLDTVAMEACNTVCVVNQYDNLGFIDMRSNNQSARWSHRNRPGKMDEAEERCYSKLAAHGTQLFSTKNDSVYVFCSPDWVLTSRLRKLNGGSISDVSVGGDRMFVLHNEEDVFDVWETPGPSGIVHSYYDV
eukprot:Gb_37959 [translate_table: standard]